MLHQGEDAKELKGYKLNHSSGKNILKWKLKAFHLIPPEAILFPYI
tara:strand:- start:78 stop:215 length:138 start_codon:yes stop_codon:yes gene_type:complete